MAVGLTVGRPEAHVTQVELGAVPMGHWALVHVSCLLVAIGFQRSTYNQPGKEKKTCKDVGGGASWLLPGRGWNREGGTEGKMG